MRDAYDNYDHHKKTALKESKELRKKFTWENMAKIASKEIDSFIKNPPKNRIEISFNQGVKLEVFGSNKEEYFVEFINSDTDKVVHSSTIKNNMWTKCSRTWFTNWVIKVNGKVIDEFNLKNKTVHIIHHSKSMGDCIAWAPYAVEFQKKHKCKVILSTFHNYWFENKKEYKNSANKIVNNPMGMEAGDGMEEEKQLA